MMAATVKAAAIKMPAEMIPTIIMIGTQATATATATQRINIPVSIIEWFLFSYLSVIPIRQTILACYFGLLGPHAMQILAGFFLHFGNGP